MIYSRSPNVLSFHIEINIIPGTDLCSWYKVEFQDWKISDLVYMDIQLTQHNLLKEKKKKNPIIRVAALS